MSINPVGLFTDPVSICNMALGALGDISKAKRMTSMARTANTNPVHHVAIDYYQASKEQMHAMMDWQRTRKVKALTVSTVDPVLVGKWTYKYVRPPDCLIFRKVIDDGKREYEYELVNEESTDHSALFNDEYIYTSIENAIGWYTILIGEERYMPGMAQLQSLILAQNLAMSVTAKESVRLALASELERRAERLCMALGSHEGYVENESGSHEYTGLY